MLTDSLVRSGHFLFRWRSYVLLIFAPLFFLAAAQGESIETQYGPWAGETLEWLAIALVVLGETIRIATVGFVPVGTSGRNTDKGQIATRLNTTGLYSVTRNPLYLGNCLMYLGVALFTQHLALTALLGLTLALYYERIIAAEEDFLSGEFGAPYRDWVAVTPAFWPRLSRWEAPDMAFSLRTVIRREHVSILGGVLALYLVELGLHRLPETADVMDAGWHWVAGAVLALAVAANLAKRAGVLRVAGR
ncbi:DUF1295 domain-containing protein [Rhodobacter sp. NTK016B]|uniref:methyltransferase family protein n=1 Tax=Rhodobacter sp. NTK016B TaxID=2759676 RepID=UPI001A8E21AD|nr:methyltransferase [Rhodobacter sp. NTK016B]MBN8290342.1 DUF1295 domain-containing protein [Rhodobacter sp. NTK016B]